MTTISRTAGRQRLAGLSTVLRLDLRRERIPLTVWVLSLTGTVVSSVAAIAGLYPTELDRVHLAASIAANPSFLALTGPVTATSVGGVTAWRVGVIGGLAVGLMSIFTVVRRTRADEESGRAELLASGVMGRDTPLTAALLLAWAASIIIGLLGALGAIGNGQPVAGSLAMGAALAGPGLVFAAVAAVCSQIFDSARTATGTAGTVLAAAFALRAAGDLWSGGGSLTWLSPLGWPEKVQAFGGNRWPVLLLFVAATTAFTAAAVVLLHRRDVGLGLFAARLGSADNPRLGSCLALAVRLHRGSWIGWAAGFAGLGLLTGSLATTAGSLLSDNPRIQQLMQDLGGPGTLAGELLAAMGAIGALVAGAYAVSAALRARTEESAGRAESVLSTAVSRRRWLGGHLLFSLLGSAMLLLIAGVCSGLVYGSAIGDLANGLGTGLAAMTVQIPAVLVTGAVTALLIGALPRLASAAWAVLGGSVLLGQLGPLLQLPQAVMDLSPYTHVPALPTSHVEWTPMIVLVLIAAVATALGVAAFQRRDVG